MALITELNVPAFDLETVHAGDLVRAKHQSWEDFRNGIVTRAMESRLIVQYLPVVGMATNHYVIRAKEAVAGEWELYWTSDMEDIRHYPETEEGTQDEGQEGGTGE